MKIACVQMNAGRDIGANLAASAELIRAAAGQEARLIATPENTTMIEPVRAEALARTPDEAHHPGLPFYAQLAKETGRFLLIGSMPVKLAPDRLANRSYLFAPDGTVLARYDKIHLFDVALKGGETYRESDQIRPGGQAVLAELPEARLGMTICYDLRFAALYRALAQAGADILSVPAAFTVPTGEAHWHVLLRARAIETGSFVIAPAQCGTHAEGRRTYGHSLIVGPWGDIRAEAGNEPGVILAECDIEDVRAARRMIPALRHDRAFTGPAALRSVAE
ncbi:MAG TPA: carbon-nitrogen hydrolase family protein [Dongiaceae bacterium]|nr:carbon-nitrogen hydrolase family protein [Dongiaceae bacterium]